MTAPRPRPGAGWAGRVAGWLRAGRGGMFLLALVVGAGSGLGAVAFRYLIYFVTWAATGHSQFGQQGHAGSAHLPWLGLGFFIVIPVIGGLLSGPLIYRFAREARGHGVPEVMIAVADSGGRIRPQVSAVKAVASAVCIGVGGSVGREGPIVQIGSALASSLGQWVKMPENRLRILVACGAAGGISATFNAPVTGVFFGVEIILREFSVDALFTVMLAAMIADITAIPFLGGKPFLSGFPPGIALHHARDYLLVAVLAVIAALMGLAFKAVLYKTEDLCDRAWQGRPEWARPAVGGIALGLLLLAIPQMYGVGYPVMDGSPPPTCCAPSAASSPPSRSQTAQAQLSRRRGPRRPGRAPAAPADPAARLPARRDHYHRRLARRWAHARRRRLAAGQHPCDRPARPPAAPAPARAHPGSRRPPQPAHRGARRLTRTGSRRRTPCPASRRRDQQSCMMITSLRSKVGQQAMSHGSFGRILSPASVSRCLLSARERGFHGKHRLVATPYVGAVVRLRHGTLVGPVNHGGLFQQDLALTIVHGLGHDPGQRFELPDHHGRRAEAGLPEFLERALHQPVVAGFGRSRLRPPKTGTRPRGSACRPRAGRTPRSCWLILCCR